ncbi:MAG: hypothetical protein Q9181_006487 [Wetmoreana brouardii]
MVVVLELVDVTHGVAESGIVEYFGVGVRLLGAGGVGTEAHCPVQNIASVSLIVETGDEVDIGGRRGDGGGDQGGTKANQDEPLHHSHRTPERGEAENEGEKRRNGAEEEEWEMKRDEGKAET